jgi:hypothetical protein
MSKDDLKNNLKDDLKEVAARAAALMEIVSEIGDRLPPPLAAELLAGVNKARADLAEVETACLDAIAAKTGLSPDLVAEWVHARRQ